MHKVVLSILGTILLLMGGAFVILPYPSASLIGVVNDANGESVAFATIILWQSEKLIAGVATDENGEYSIQSLNPGNYVVECRAYFYESSFDSVHLEEARTTKLDISLEPDRTELDEPWIPERRIPLIEAKPVLGSDPVNTDSSFHFRGPHASNNLYLIDSTIYREGKPIEDRKN